MRDGPRRAGPGCCCWPPSAWWRAASTRSPPPPRPTSPATPTSSSIRQALYVAVGLVLMLAISRIDYSRLREWKAGLYGAADRGDRASSTPSAVGHARLQARDRASASSRSRPPSWARSCSSSRCRPSWSTGCGGSGDRETTSRIMLLALFPAMLVIAQPDLGSGLVYISIALAILFVAGTQVDPFRGAGRPGRHRRRDRPRGGAGDGGRAAQAVPGGPPHVVRQPGRGPGGGGLPADSSRWWPSAPVGRPGAATRRRRPGWTSCPSTTPISSSAWWARSSDSWGRRLVLSLYALLIWRCLRILTMSKNLYGTLIAAGITAMFMHQVFINVGMAIGIMPITGVTLPLLSYGGSSVTGHLPGPWPSSVDPRAGARDGFRQGPRHGSMSFMRGIFEKASTRHGRPWRNPCRHPRGGGHAPR